MSKFVTFSNFPSNQMIIDNISYTSDIPKDGSSSILIHDGSLLTFDSNSNFKIFKSNSIGPNITLISVVDKPSIAVEDKKQDGSTIYPLNKVDIFNKMNEELAKDSLEFIRHQTQQETKNYLIFTTMFNEPLITIKNIIANNSIKIHDLKQIAKHLNVEKILFGTIQNDNLSNKDTEIKFSELPKLLGASEANFLRDNLVCKNNNFDILPNEIKAIIGWYVDGQINLGITNNQPFWVTFEQKYFADEVTTLGDNQD